MEQGHALMHHGPIISQPVENHSPFLKYFIDELTVQNICIM